MSLIENPWSTRTGEDYWAMMQEYICPEAEAYVLLTSHIFCLHLTQSITPVHTTSLQYPFWLSARIPLTQDLHFASSISYHGSIYFQYFSQLLKNTLWFFKVGNPTEQPTKMCVTSPESCVHGAVTLVSQWLLQNVNCTNVWSWYIFHILKSKILNGLPFCGISVYIKNVN